jgi:hypothetical protein
MCETWNYKIWIGSAALSTTTRIFLLFKLYEITGFHLGVIEIFTYLGCYLFYVSHQTNLHHTRTHKSEELVYKLLTTTSEIQNRMKTCLNLLYNLFGSLVWNTCTILNHVSLPYLHTTNVCNYSYEFYVMNDKTNDVKFMLLPHPPHRKLKAELMKWTD